MMTPRFSLGNSLIPATRPRRNSFFSWMESWASTSRNFSSMNSRLAAGLFRAKLADEFLDAVRTATNGGWALDDDKFKR
jgi:hypothetical protein